MSIYEIKLRRTDILFSQWLRKKRGYRCDYDGQFFPEGRGLEVSHFFSRRNESVRFDEENCDVFCRKIHRYFEQHKTEYEQWKASRMSPVAYARLILRAHHSVKRDDKLTMLWLKQEMKNLNEGIRNGKKIPVNR